MRSILKVVVMSLLIFAACNPFVKKKSENPATDSIPVKTEEQLLAEEKARQDSIRQAEFEQMQQTPFGNLRFGMSKEEVMQKNEKRQTLGKYPYTFSYSFAADDQLYKVRISSDGVKLIHYDSELKANYQNLYSIIKTKYGDPETRHEFPSIFEVQDVKKYNMSKWTQGTKQIQLSLLENELNSYSSVCEITDSKLNAAEMERISKEKNKDVIEASEKF